ncbi:MAG: STAS domain-containing protein [Fimbriimonadales bacterium]|nr:STAS domain-containing protein [Fimbriimonadales bacterium]
MIELKTGKKGYQLRLQGELRFEQLPELLTAAQQIEAQPKPTTVEWSNLQGIHYACLQVLIALGKSLEASGHSIAFKEPSPDVYDRLNRYGIWQTLVPS